MTLRSFALGQRVLVRGEIAACTAHAAVVRLPALKLANPLPVELSIGDIFLPPDTEAARLAAQLVQQRLDALGDATLRAIAEIYELAGHPAPPLAQSLRNTG